MKHLSLVSQVFLILSTLQLFLLCSVVHVWPSDEAKVIFCDVGQGDSTLIFEGFTQALVDAGPENKKALDCLQRHLPWFDVRLDLFIATHPDLDHIGGAEAALDRLFITHLFIVPDAKNTDGFYRFRELVLRKKEQGTVVSFPTSGQSGFILPCKDCSKSGISYAVLSPLEDLGLSNVFDKDIPETILSALIEEHESMIKNYNDRSISVLLHIQNKSIFLTGDMEEKTEHALATQRLLTPVTVLKVAHHGAKTSSTSLFLSKVRPEEVIISAGIGNRYKHPAEEILTRVKETGSRIWRTDVHGEIMMTISEGTYRVEGEKK